MVYCSDRCQQSAVVLCCAVLPCADQGAPDWSRVPSYVVLRLSYAEPCCVVVGHDMLCCAAARCDVLCCAAARCAVPCCAEPVLGSHDTDIGGVVQGDVLPAGLDLSSISALAAALGVQSVAMPGVSRFLCCSHSYCHSDMILETSSAFCALKSLLFVRHVWQMGTKFCGRT